MAYIFKFKKGDRVIFQRNCHRQHYLKGDVGIIDQESDVPYVIVEKSGRTSFEQAEYMELEVESPHRFSPKWWDIKLKEAQEKYPKGTKFKIIDASNHYAISDGMAKYVKGYEDYIRMGTAEDPIYTPIVYTYSRGWAEIVEIPKELSVDIKPEDILLEEARRRYPRGTKFDVAHIGGRKDSLAISDGNPVMEGPNVKVGSLIPCAWIPCVYYSGTKKWADIVEMKEENQTISSPSPAKLEFDVGDIVVCTLPNISCTEYIGKIGKITKVHQSYSYPYWTEFKEGLGTLWCQARKASDVEISAYNNGFSSLEAYLKNIRDVRGHPLEGAKPININEFANAYLGSGSGHRVYPYPQSESAQIWGVERIDRSKKKYNVSPMEEYIQSPVIINKAPKSKIIIV